MNIFKKISIVTCISILYIFIIESLYGINYEQIKTKYDIMNEMFSKLVIACKKKKIKIILTKDTLIGWFTNNKLIPYCNKICIIVYESDLCMIKPIIQDLYEKYSKHDIYICV